MKEAQSIGHQDSDEKASSGEEWGGFDDRTLDKGVSDYEEEYLDEDRFTTVTIENVQVTRDGLEKQLRAVEGSESDSNITSVKSQGKPQRVWTKEKPNRPKKKKKKFRYENKADRKMTRHKEKAGGRAQAMARKQ